MFLIINNSDQHFHLRMLSYHYKPVIFDIDMFL